MSLILGLAILFQEDSTHRFFSKRDVDFWGKKRPTATGSLWPETMPAHVRDLLEQPTRENALKYLEWQRARAEKLQKAMQLLEEAKGAPKDGPKDGPVLQYFSQSGCPYCAEEEKVLASLKNIRVVRVTDPELWKKYKVSATPTLIFERKGREPKIWRGYVSRERLMKELLHGDR